ncbi:MAG: hypothetical protein GY722_00160 [bacterium]|nr:hypothetical protein [bacterium]
MPKYWMNVDHPNKTCVIHTNGCSHVVHRLDAGHKGLDVMSRDGGWFSFESYSEAKGFFSSDVAQYGVAKLKQCDDCH